MEYTTSDFNIAAYLFTLFPEMLREVQGEGRLKQFIFEDDDAIHAHVEDYYRNTARVNPRRYAESMRTLKGMINQK